MVLIKLSVLELAVDRVVHLTCVSFQCLQSVFLGGEDKI